MQKSEKECDEWEGGKERKDRLPHLTVAERFWMARSEAGRCGTAMACFRSQISDDNMKDFTTNI